jgi:hypothetical protein
MQGALRGLGQGLIEGFAGSRTGLTYAVASGCAIAPFVLEAGSEGVVFVDAPDGLEVTLPDDSPVWLWLQAALPDDTDYDARQDAVVFLVYTTTATQPPNSLPLEKGTTTGGVYAMSEDLREMCPARSAADLAAAIAQLQSAVGDAYLETPQPDGIDTRLSDLETMVGGGGGGDGTPYWKNMPESPSSARTPEQMAQAVADADVAAHVAALHQGETPGGEESTPVEAFDIDANNQSRALLKTVRSVDADGAETQVDAVTIVWGVYGDGSGGSPDFIDRVNSTWEFGA